MEPFDTLRNELPGWTLAIAGLDGNVMGYTDVEARTIWVDIQLSDRERRCTIMHEAIHALRGDRHDDPATETAARQEAARRLLACEALCAALATEPHPDDLCAALDVDLDTLETRLRNLDVNERAAVRRAASRLTRPDRARPDLCSIGRWWIAYQMPGEPTCATVHPNGVEYEYATIQPNVFDLDVAARRHATTA